MENKKIAGVTFEEVGKVYNFDATSYPDLAIGDAVIVETSRGTQLAHIVSMSDEDENSNASGLKAIDRPASPKDLLMRQMLEEKEVDAIKITRDHLSHTKFSSVKVVSAEYTFDGKHLTLQVNTESDPKFDVKFFHRDLSKKFSDTRVEIRQVGPRDVAKALGGLGACGLEKRCCTKFLTEFSSISIRMAKTQDISLTPSEITGICGRLRCCLIYEYPIYVDAKKSMPKVKNLIDTPLGKGKVIQLNPLAQSLVVFIPEVGRRKFTMEEIESGKMAVPEVIPDVDIPEDNPDIEYVNTEKPVTVKSQRSDVGKRHKKGSRNSSRGRRNRNKK